MEGFGFGRFMHWFDRKPVQTKVTAIYGMEHESQAENSSFPDFGNANGVERHNLTSSAKSKCDKLRYL